MSLKSYNYDINIGYNFNFVNIIVKNLQQKVIDDIIKNFTVFCSR